MTTSGRPGYSFNKKAQIARRAAKAFGLSAILLALIAVVAYAAPITIEDDAGPDDEPGQKDLNQLTVDFTPGDGHDIDVTWNWDIISVSGSNTGDACSLYDTDNDGNANYSLCVIWNDGASYQTTRLYVCGDDAADKCTQPRELLAEDVDGDGDLEEIVEGPYFSTCSLSLVSDTFGARSQAQADTTQDTQATCHIDLDDFGGAAGAFLINVCSYPSQVPGSDPSDCVVTPNSGFLTIVKVASPDDPAFTFTFSLGAGQTSQSGDNSWPIDGSGSVDLISFAAGSDYDLTEVSPVEYQLDSASCELSDGTPTGSFDTNTDTVSDIEIQVGRETTCTFTNSEDFSVTRGTIVINKVTDPSGGTGFGFTDDIESPNSFSLNDGDSKTFLNVNPDSSPFSVSETSLPSGWVLTSASCTNDNGTPGDTGDDVTDIDPSSIDLAAQETVTCTFTNLRLPLLTVTKTVVNDNGGSLGVGAFPLFVGATSVTSGVQNSFESGSYVVSETEQDGYTASSWGGDCAPDGSITLAIGDVKACTITNDDDAPSLILKKHVISDNGGAAVASDWDLSAGPYTVEGSEAGAEATDQAGTYALSEADDGSGNTAGYTNTSVSCDNGDGPGSVTIGLGETVICTFENDDIPPTLTLLKTVQGGDAAASDFQAYIDGSPVAWSVAEVLSAGAHTASEDVVPGYDGGDWGGDCATDGSITLALDQDATCTVTNTARGMADVLKTTNLGTLPPPIPFDFQIRSGATPTEPGEIVAIATFPAGGTTAVPFICSDGISADICEDIGGMAKIVPGDYQFCEIVPLPWIPNLVDPFVPDGDAPEPDNSIRCVNFTLDPGELESFVVDNIHPGDNRTIGYWKNWTTCDGRGNQGEKGSGSGDPEDYITILDEVLPIYLGDFRVVECWDGVAILDKRKIVSDADNDPYDGQKMANDAAFSMAAQLLAAKANIAGVWDPSLTVIADEIVEADALLTLIGFNGSQGSIMSYLPPNLNKSDLLDLFTVDELREMRSDALRLAGIFDDFNNNDL